MTQSYNYQTSFWDEQDAGARILLDHTAHGIESCHNLVIFYEERSKLEKDYARRLSAVSGRLHDGLQNSPEYGKLGESFKSLHSTQERLSQFHSKAAVAIHKDGHAELKQFVQQIKARYKTIDIKVRNLCNDKITKRQLCDVLKEKLNKANIELRDCQLNKDNYLGKRDSDQNDRQLLKWRSIVDELQLKLDVLKQEYKASSKHWLHEWSNLSLELQELERTRIEFIKLKLEQFAKQCSEMAMQEQANMESLTQQLVKFTAAQDITNFAYNHGTGRIRGASMDSSTTTTCKERPNYNSSKISSKHVQNVRQLSSQLQRTRLSAHYDHEKPEVPQSSSRPMSCIEPEPTHQWHFDVNQLKVPSVTETSPENSTVEAAKGNYAAYTTSESSNDSSNPTDFTAHTGRRASIESMNTSISSLAHSIDDSRRFAKSWNSQNRRKSKTRSQLFDSSQGTSLDGNSRSSSMETTRIHVKPQNAQAYVPAQRRKSMVRTDSDSNPFKQALDAMKKESEGVTDNVSVSSRSSSKSKPLIPFHQSRHPTAEHDPKAATKRVMDGDQYVELPRYSSNGEEVIQYAKALYTFMDANEQMIVNFRAGDFLLLTEKLDNDWFIGEVLDTAHIDPKYRHGIIPHNYIELLI
ncbi:LAME_0H12354g1_1 [Lachancea meyersii CBS 8951]|uniref:LAME_0H12354g1_1 n=1 Tax=Lachancea meyersii CBS 8951 TaxID=1266667 RepID=A0A1G4KGN2_9SACH|nr:LAME_0H12354g1_1 [Lachancea meyersii CBS 8951]